MHSPPSFAWDEGKLISSPPVVKGPLILRSGTDAPGVLDELLLLCMVAAALLLLHKSGTLLQGPQPVVRLRFGGGVGRTESRFVPAENEEAHDLPIPSPNSASSLISSSTSVRNAGSPWASTSVRR